MCANWTGINFCAVSSLTIESCTKLSTRGLAREALTGVTKSIQYEESLGVKNGI